ncbi:hypothetical protein [Streptomyces sp. NBC_00620]|uniref:hypothetical protein n=1 Tax=Streptomyces sp. NBC_00620 TaxID=2903666 RepID=UPI00225B5B7C|nr:hypothetical protein [Streptomyces sp. NBC_00620]MCX4976451.1 hypothetical protein [Streptomyces sp. NBC_00620]
MLNRPAAAHAELQDLSADLEVKAARRKWNPALHPRDSKGRFIETGGTVRLWGGQLARVVRALPNDRILVEDQTGPNEFNGRRHTTSAKWVSMVARPDGSAPTESESKVVAEDEKRNKDPRRGNGVARDDDGDPDTPNDPHDSDDQGRPIGDDDGDGPDDDDDQDEPADGAHPVSADALPNQQHAAGARFADTAAVRRHFTQLADRPGQKPKMAQFLRSVALDDDLQVTPSGRLVILRDDETGRWYLTPTGTGQRMDAAGDFDSPQDAARFAAHLDNTIRAGGTGNAPFDFSDPDLDQAARGWRSSNDEDIRAAIVRARAEFDNDPAPSGARKATAAPPSATPGQRFKTLKDVRTHWTTLRETASPRDQKNLDVLLANRQLKLAGDGQVVLAKRRDGLWQLVATGNATPFGRAFARQRDAQDVVNQLVASAVRGRDGEPLDLSDPDLSVTDWRSEDNRSLTEVFDQELAGHTADAIKEKRERRAAAQEQQGLAQLRSRRPVADLDDEQLRAEQAELARTRSSYETDNVAEARRQRMAAIEAELERRGNESGEGASNAEPAGEPEAYDPSLQQQTDANGRLTYYRTPQGVSRDIAGRFGVGEPVTTRFGETYIVISGNDDGTINVRKEPLYDDAPLGRSETFQASELRTKNGFRPWRPDAAQAAADESTPPPDGPDEVTLSPDEVNAPAAAARASKAPSAMDDGEIRDEIVSLMEREMANGGQLDGVDTTRLRVLEAEEARRAGRKPKEEPKPKPKAPAEEPGGLFNVDQADAPQPTFADPDNPYDQPDDPTGTPDMIAAAEGRDTSKLRPPQTRAPLDFEVGDRFVAADGRTHTVADKPVRTGRGRVRVVDEDGREHFLNPDNELRVLHPDEEASEASEANAPEGNTLDADAPESDAPSTDAPEGETPADDDPEIEGPEAETPASDDADAPAGAEPTTAPDQITIDHSGTGTVVRFPTPNGMVSDEWFAVLRSLGFKASRDRTKPRFFYLQSNMTLSRRDDRVQKLKKWLDGRNVAYQAPEESTEKPELSEEQLEQLKGRYSAPAGTWAVTDFQPGDEVWTGRSWDTVDSIGPKNLRLQSRGSTPYDSVLARRRGGEIRTMFDEPADDGTPRPGATDPIVMRDEQITEELTHLRNATLPEGNDPTARTVRRQVTARIRALTETQAARIYARQRDEINRRDQSGLVRDPARLAAKKAEQVQGRDGAPIGIVYQEKKGKWSFVDRDGRTPNKGVDTPLTVPTRAAAITALNKLNDARNERAGEGWKHSAWDDVQAGDTIRVPELGPSPTGRGRTITGWSEPLEVTEVRRDGMGQVILSGRRGDEDVTLEVPRTDATFGASKPGTVPERERSEAGGGMPWQQMRPEDFGQDELPAAGGDPNAPRPTDEFGPPDLIANGAADNAVGDETAAARMVLDGLPELPQLPSLAGLSRQDKDSVRRLREDHAKIRQSLEGILAGDPPTGDAREDLRRVREQLDFVFGRLSPDLVPDAAEALAARSALLDLGQALDQALAALPDRDPQPLGDGPNGGTLFHPWDLNDGDLVRFDAHNPADRERSLATYYGTFRGRASSASGEQGRTLVTYQSLRWNDDRQRWENDQSQHTVTMPPRGLVERFTQEQWDAWQRPEQSRTADSSTDTLEVPPAPIGETSPADMDDAAIAAELEAMEAWRLRHVVRGAEGPSLPIREASEVAREIGSRRGALLDEARKRSNDNDKQRRREKEAREKAEALARAEIGKRNADGAYPVNVDGRPEVGTVRKLGGKWEWNHADGGSSGLMHSTRDGAVAHLVRVDDFRREQADRLAQQDQARREIPDGWVLGDRDDVAENDIIRVPITHSGRDGRPYPVAWRAPMRVTGVNRNDNGTMVVSVANLNGSRSDISPLFLSRPDDTFAWADDRTRPEPTPEWRHELRLQMADIGDDIATLRGLEGLEDPERILHLGVLIRRVGDGNSDDLQGDLRRIRDEAAWLEGQFANPDLPHETRNRKSWATAAHRKAEAALAHPDFQNVGASPDGPDDSPHAAPDDTDRPGGEPLAEGESVSYTPQPGLRGVIKKIYDTPIGLDPHNTMRVADVEFHYVNRKPLVQHGVPVDDLERSDTHVSEAPPADVATLTIRTLRMLRLVEEATDVTDGGSLPEMRQLRHDIEGALARSDHDPRAFDGIGERLDALAEQYELAGPQGEHAADLFRRAARIARGEQDDSDNQRVDGENRDGQDDDSRDETQEEGTPENEDDDQQGGGQDDEERRDGNGDIDGEAADPDGEPDASGTGTPEPPGDSSDSSSNDDGPDSADDEQDAPETDENGQRRRRRRRERGGGNGGPGGGPGGPGLPRLNLPESNDPTTTGNDDSDGGRSRPRHSGVASLRNAWRNGDGLSPAEDTPERRALLTQAADREGLTLSPESGLVTWPEPQDDGSTLWRFAQARNGTNLPGITLTSDDQEEARALAGRFEALAGSDGQPFDWHQAWGPSTVAQWRDSEGRNLPSALRAARDDFEQQRATTAAPELPEDLTQLSDLDLDELVSQPLTQDDMLRVMAEMDRRDDPDQRVRDAVPDTPPADAADAERRGKAMDDALGFGNTDFTRPQRTREEALRAEFADIDEARYQAALEFTNGYFFKRKYKYADGLPSERDLFSGGSLSAFGLWEKYASPELLEWFDNNGGRQTFNQFKLQRRAEERRYKEEYEAQQAAAAQSNTDTVPEPDVAPDDVPEPDVAPDGVPEAGVADDVAEMGTGAPRFTNVDEIRERIRRGELDKPSHPTMAVDPQNLAITANGPTLEMSEGGRLAIMEWLPNGDGWRVYAPGSMEVLAHAFNREDALAFARVLEGVRDEDGRPFLWDAPDAAERALAFRGPDGESLGATVARQMTDRGADEGLDKFWQRDSQRRHLQESAIDGYYDAWRAQQEADGYTIPVDVEDVQPGDDITALSVADFDRPVTNRGRAREPLKARQSNRTGTWPFTNGSDYSVRTEERIEETDPSKEEPTRQSIFDSFFFRNTPERPTAFRRPRPGEEEQNDRKDTPQPEPSPTPPPTPRPEPTPDSAPDTPEPATPEAPAEEPQGTPEPVGGKPAHWARVGDLVPGDMVRMDGATKNGRAVTRAGYVFTSPVRVEVTRRGRTEHMWRTWVTENPDGTGKAGNVFTPLNATVARAEAPDDVVPGSPVSGAQSSVQTGSLPDVIPADRNGRGLFPGSTVIGVDGLRRREGTITGATNTTVAVRWDNGDTDDALPPTALTVTGGDRPDGWTAYGQRVTPRHVVTDTDGALLGPVDEVNGDRVTITTAEGTVTRSAGDLRVSGEVRDDAPDTAAVTGIDNPAAADLKEGDVVVLDLDGELATVSVTGTRRDGDRVTIEYADTTTGEMGQIDLDASAVLPRAQGSDSSSPELGPEDAPDTDDDLTVHDPPQPVDPVTGTTGDPELTMGDRTVIDDQADGPDDDPDAHQAAVRITSDLPVTPEQATALATQLRASADPSTAEGRAALRAADHLDQAAGRTPPAGLDRPRPSNVAQLGEGDMVAMPDERRGDRVRVFRVIDAEEGPGGVRRLLLEDENKQWRRRVVHGAMPVWLLPEAEPEAPTPPDVDDDAPAPAAPNTPSPSAPSTPSSPAPSSTPDAPMLPVARVLPGSLRVGDVIDAPVSRTGYQFNGHRRLTIISPPHRQGWWMQLTGVDDDGNVHDFGLHNGRDVNVYERNRPTPALPPAGAPRDPNPIPQSAADRIVADHPRAVAARIIDEAIAGTEPPGDIHALREQIAQRLTAEALRDARQAARQEANDALNAAGITGPERDAAKAALKQARQDAHTATVKAALRTINDLEPLPDETEEELAARARDLLRLIPNQIGDRQTRPDADGDRDVARAVAGHTNDAVNTLLQQLQAAGFNAGDAERIARLLTGNLNGSRQATARRIAQRIAAASPAAGRQPGLLARIVALLIRLAKRLAEIVKAAARKIAEKWQDSRERLARLRAFIGRLVTRVRHWPESRRLARLHRAVNLPAADGESMAARVAHWAGLMPEPGRFGQASRRVTWWRPTTWGQLAAGRLPDRSDRIQWTPDRATDGGPGLTALRHMAALRAAGNDVDQDVTRRLAAALGDDFGDDPHATLQLADNHVATSERRLVNLQAARSGATIPDDPDLEVEITAARMELRDARREWGDLRTRYAAAVPDAVAAALADVREMGPEGNAGIVFGPDTDPDAERAVRGVQHLIPRTWLNTPAARRVTAVGGTQGSYEPEGQRITVADLADDGLGTAGHALAQHLAQHIGDLDAAQRAFWFTRTHTGRPGARRMRRSALSRLLSRQQTQPETGDTLARSIQAMFTGDWYQDDDLRAFLLGLLATR